jgi:thiamine-phosphate pyrophosphorylase
MKERIHLPRLYCIVDAGCFADGPDRTARLAEFTRELMAGGARLIQYRNKSNNSRQMLSDARELRLIVTSSTGVSRAAPASAQRSTNKFRTANRQLPKANDQRPVFIMNDRADLCLAAGCDGVHLGEDDLSPDVVRRIIGKRLWMGISTHTIDQVAAADATDADYIAIGPVFPTGSKQDPDPVVGLEGVRRARTLTRKPLVAIGGITRKHFRDVLNAGADSVAAIRDLLDEPRAAVEEFLAG